MGVKVWRELCEISAMSEIAVDSRLGRAGSTGTNNIVRWRTVGGGSQGIAIKVHVAEARRNIRARIRALKGFKHHTEGAELAKFFLSITQRPPSSQKKEMQMQSRAKTQSRKGKAKGI